MLANPSSLSLSRRAFAGGLCAGTFLLAGRPTQTLGKEATTPIDETGFVSIGGIDQWSDSTDVLSDPVLARKLGSRLEP